MRKKTGNPKAEQLIEAASEDLIKAWLIFIHAGEYMDGFTNKGTVVLTAPQGEAMGITYSVKLTIKNTEILNDGNPAPASNKKPGATNTGPAPKTQKGRRA